MASVAKWSDNLANNSRLELSIARSRISGVEVADREVRIMGSKSDLLRTLAAISGVKSATGGVRSSVSEMAGHERR
jgi:hypothetical protein